MNTDRNSKEMPQLSREQLGILQHSLGLDQYGRGNAFRNYYVSKPTRDLKELVRLGLMRDGGARKVYAGDHLFVVTIRGKDVVGAQSPEPPKLTESKRRYQRFLAADSGMSFIEWLKLKRYA